MQPGEALSTAAQIAVALAGFAGVVVAFRSSSLHEWSLLDKYRLWLLRQRPGPLLLLFVRHALADDQTDAVSHLALVQWLFAPVGLHFWFFEPATPIRTTARGN
jgi:hypothetical protein